MTQPPRDVGWSAACLLVSSSSKCQELHVVPAHAYGSADGPMVDADTVQHPSIPYKPIAGARVLVRAAAGKLVWAIAQRAQRARVRCTSRLHHHTLAAAVRETGGSVVTDN